MTLSRQELRDNMGRVEDPARKFQGGLSRFLIVGFNFKDSLSSLLGCRESSQPWKLFIIRSDGENWELGNHSLTLPMDDMVEFS